MATRIKKIVFALIFCFIFSSCKTYKKVDWINPKILKEDRKEYFEPRQLSRISEGDYLSVLTTDSTAYEITYTGIRNDSIQGLFTRKNNLKIREPIESGIPISDIYVLKVKRVNGWVSLAVGVAIPLMIWGYFILNPLRFSY